MWIEEDIFCTNNDLNPLDHALFSLFYFSYPTRKREKEKLYKI